MKDIAINDSKATPLQQPHSHLAKKTTLSQTSKSTRPHCPTKHILKRSRLLRIRPKNLHKTLQHPLYSVSEDSKIHHSIESNAKIVRTQFCSVAEEPSQQQQQMVDNPEDSSGMIDENFKFDLQRLQIVHLLPQIRKHMNAQQPIYIPKASLQNDERADSNRSSLCVWIFELCSQFGFREETGFLTVNIIDRITGLKRISNEILPLLGVTALFMAAKYEEIKVPVAQDFVHLLSTSKFRTSKQAVLRLQSTILLLLDFNLSYISPLVFICDQAKQLQLSPEALQETKALARKLILHSTARYWSPSLLATYCIQTVMNGGQ